MIQRIVKLRLAGPVKIRYPSIHPERCGGIWSMNKGIVATIQSPYTTENPHERLVQLVPTFISSLILHLRTLQVTVLYLLI